MVCHSCGTVLIPANGGATQRCPNEDCPVGHIASAYWGDGLQRRLAAAETIISNLAVEDPERLCPDGLVRCQLCDADGVDPEGQSIDRDTAMVLNLTDHEPSCAWRLAQEYRASDPVHHSG